jgi:hypothetical protein
VYRVGISAGRVGIGFPPSYEWAVLGEKWLVELSDSDRTTATTLLLICRAPKVRSWLEKHEVCYIASTWELDSLPEFEAKVLNRLYELQRSIEAVIWTWTPGQAEGIVLESERSYRPFYLRGNTLFYENRITNVTVSLEREQEPRYPHRGELFPEEPENW